MEAFDVCVLEGHAVHKNCGVLVEGSDGMRHTMFVFEEIVMSKRGLYSEKVDMSLLL